MTRTEQLVRDLRRRARALVDRKVVRRPKLARDADVSYFWLCRFLAEHEDAQNPTANNLSKLEKRVVELERIQ